MTCHNCGAALGPDERFCRSCGAAVQAPGESSFEDVWAAPVEDGKPPRAPRQRPGWLIPAIVAGAILVVAVIAGVVVLGGGGGSKSKPLADQAGPIVSPVSSGLAKLSSDLGAAKSAAALKTAGTEASTLSDTAHGAAISVRGLDVGSEDETGARLLAAALDSTQAYADAVASAASDKAKSSIADANSSGTAAKAAFAAAAAAVPGLDPPDDAVFVVSIKTGGGGTTTAHTNGEVGTASAAYVRAIDALLTKSAKTRKNLGDLISGVSDGSIPADVAAMQAQQIIDQREKLSSSVDAVPPPDAFVDVSDLLVDSIDAALDDDEAIQEWVLAKGQNDTVGADNAWKDHLGFTAKATKAKAAFVKAYNTARKKQLGLGPFAVGDKY